MPGRVLTGRVPINRLGKRDIGAMIDAVVGNKPLTATIREDIIERTDGIPLFVEEMTKAALEAERDGDTKHTAVTPSLARAVPASLQASLMARLDRLGPAKKKGENADPAIIDRALRAANESAKDAAPFLHPRLSAVEHSGSPVDAIAEMLMLIDGKTKGLPDQSKIPNRDMIDVTPTQPAPEPQAPPEAPVRRLPN